MLQIIFGDDEHTAADGPYVRVMKTRKWIYISAIALSVLNAGLYNELEAAKLLKVISAPSGTVSLALGLGLSYLTIQYSFLLLQLYSVYDIVLRDRMAFRRAEELNAISLKVKESKINYDKSVAAVFSARDAHKNDLLNKLITDEKSINSDLSALIKQQKSASQTLIPAAAQIELKHRIESLSKRRSKARSELQKFHDSPEEELDVESIPAVQEARELWQEAKSSLSELQSQVPSERKGYRKYEVAIDIFRCAPPLALSLGTIGTYLLNVL